jgi:hypothetical protein
VVARAEKARRAEIDGGGRSSRGSGDAHMRSAKLGRGKRQHGWGHVGLGCTAEMGRVCVAGRGWPEAQIEKEKRKRK